MRTMRVILMVVFLALAVCLTSCIKGDEGPMGPGGLQGEQGPPGEDGASWEFAYYQGMCLNSDVYFVSVPELAEKPRPIVQILIAISAEYAQDNHWTPVDEVPGVFVGLNYDGGNVGFVDLPFGYYYLIIVAVPTE